MDCVDRTILTLVGTRGSGLGARDSGLGEPVVVRGNWRLDLPWLPLSITGSPSPQPPSPDKSTIRP